MTPHDRASATKSRGPAVPSTTPAEQALEILQRSQRVAQQRALAGPERQLLDAVQPLADAFQFDQRPQQPRAQQPPAHGARRAIDLVEQRAVPLALAAGDELQVAAGHGVDAQGVGRRPERQGLNVAEVRFVRVAQIPQQASGGSRGGHAVAHPETVEALDPELLQERTFGRPGVERTLVRLGDGAAERGDLGKGLGHRCAARDQYLAWAQDAQLVGQRLRPAGAGVFGGAKLAGGEIDQCHADTVHRADPGPGSPAATIAIRNSGSRASR